MLVVCLGCFLTLQLTTTVIAQDIPVCKEDEVLAQLDFWIGDWIVYDAEDNQVGTNTIARIMNSCVIQEIWQGSEGGLGMSIFYKSPISGKLKQLWVTDVALGVGGTKEKESYFVEVGEQIVFRGRYPYQGGQIIDRTTLTRESENQVRQFMEISTDSGVSWQPLFLGIYKRKEI